MKKLPYCYVERSALSLIIIDSESVSLKHWGPDFWYEYSLKEQGDLDRVYSVLMGGYFEYCVFHFFRCF